ncbi:MAG: 3-dehydroquinate dehydratase [Firmicutes bacterium]|nr:3-dehydroquinate dehydratase [Bacillota bacterium]
MKILVINGPNLNMLGIREPDKYGSESYHDLVEKIEKHCCQAEIEVDFYQSNHEGDMVDRIQQAYYEGVDAMVLNPGAYTHTSIALLDALKAVGIPAAEVHISKVEEREAFRQISYVREACCFTVTGHGTDGYLEAIDFLEEKIKDKK